jgi:hypothetical protein
MAQMTLAQFRTQVLLMLMNMDVSHPAYTSGAIDRAINHAPNRLIGMGPDMFEKKGNSWTSNTATLVGASTMTLPTDLLILTDLASADSASLPDWASTQERMVVKDLVHTIAQLAKSSTVVDYPQLWDRKADKVLYWPTTRTGKTTYFRFYGIAREQAISNASDQFTLSEDWDRLISRLAAEEVARDILGWSNRADEWLANVRDEMAERIGVLNEELTAHLPRISIAGTPR